MRETPLDVTVKYLEGIQWPASRDEVVAAAQRNGAPADAVDALRSTEHERYVGPNAVHNALWVNE